MSLETDKPSPEMTTRSKTSRLGMDSSNPEISPFVEAMERLLDARFSKLDSRIDGIEEKLTNLNNKMDLKTSTLDQKIKKNRDDLEVSLTKTLNERLSLLNNPTSATQSSHPGGGFFGKKKVVPGASNTQEPEDVKSSLIAINNQLALTSGDIGKTLSSMDNKIDETQRRIDEVNSKISNQETVIKDVLQEITKCVPDDEMKNLIPKIVQLQTNLDFLLTGESETNALIDTVIPTITKLQKDVETFTVSQEQERTKFKDEIFPKIQKSLDDIYSKTKNVINEVIDNSEDVLEKNSKTLKGLDDLKLKFSRLEENIIRMGGRSRSVDHQRSSQSRRPFYHSEERRDSRDDLHRKSVVSDSDSEGDQKNKTASTPPRVDGDSTKDILSELAHITKGIEHLEKEIRKIDVMDLVEERVIPNVYTIRKNLEQFMSNQGPPHAGPHQGFRRSYSGRTYYGKYADDPTIRKRYEDFRRGRAVNRRGINPVRGTKWTYDEHGNREQASDEEGGTRSRSHSRSPKRSSRSRSKDSESGERSKERGKSLSKNRERSTSPDSEDGEIQIMEKQIGKIAIAVEEIQDKMDSWLKYSKKTLAKSDANTESLMEKLLDASKVVVAIHDKMEVSPNSVESALKPQLVNEVGEKGTHTVTLEDEFKDKIVSGVQSKLCEFGSMFESLTSDLSLKIDSNNKPNDESFSQCLDDIAGRIKKNDSHIKSVAENTSKLISLVKKVEQNEKNILHEIQATLGSVSSVSKGEGSLIEVSKLLVEVSPRLNDLYIKILPVLEEIKHSNKKITDKESIDKKEDSRHIQKILDLVEDIKEESNRSDSGVILTPKESGNMDQVYKALNELKIIINGKDTTTIKHLNEIKSDNMKMLGKLNELHKNTKPNEKLAHKVYNILDELRKNNSTDAKTISQMNTVLQGLKASGPAYENKVLGSLKDLKDTFKENIASTPTLEDLKPLLEKDALSDTGDISSELKILKKGQEMLKNLLDNDLLSEFKNVINKLKFEDSKKRAEEMNNVKQHISAVEKKFIDALAKDHRLVLQEIRKTEKNVTEVRTYLDDRSEKSEARSNQVSSGHNEGLRSYLKEMEESLLKELKSIDLRNKDSLSNPKVTPGPTRKMGPASKKHLTTESQQLPSNCAIEALNDKLIQIEQKMFKEAEFKAIMDELTKFHNLGSEILNSVEDLKMLTSSTPIALHDIVPKIEKIHSVVLEIPNEFLSAMAATEENLCLNLDAKIKDQHQITLQELFEKFDLMDSRMAVIKKYAKHGPQANSSAQGTSTTHSESGADESFTNSRQLTDLKNLLMDEMRGTLTSLDEVKKSLETLSSLTVPVIEEIRELDKQILQEQAKSIVVEDQLEALCNTILQPIQKLSSLGAQKDISMQVSERNVESVITSSNMISFSSSINKMEERLGNRQIECINLLMELVSTMKEFGSAGGRMDAFGAHVKTAVEAAILPIIPSSERGNGSRVDILERDTRQRVESVKQLVQYFKKVQDLEVEIISKSDKSIELQARLNEHLGRVVPNVDRVRCLLEAISSTENDEERVKSFAALDGLCEEIVQHLKGIAELSHKSSEPRSQSIDELKEFVRLSVSVMERLLKEDTESNIGTTLPRSIDFQAAEEQPSLEMDVQKTPEEAPCHEQTLPEPSSFEEKMTKESKPPLKGGKATKLIKRLKAPLKESKPPQKPQPSIQDPSKDPQEEEESQKQTKNPTKLQPTLAENPFFENPNLRKKSLKRKIGPKRHRPNYVDEGPMKEEESTDKSTSASSLPNMQPIVKLIKTSETENRVLTPLKIKRPRISASHDPTESSSNPPVSKKIVLNKRSTKKD